MSAFIKNHLRKSPTLAAIIVALLVLLAGFFFAPAATIGSWLAADLAVLGLSLGALLVLMIHDLSVGRWGEALRPPLLAMAIALPFPLIWLLAPIFGVERVLPWIFANPESLADEVRKKLVYLDPAFLIGRTIVIAAIWLAILWVVALRPDNRAASRKTWSVVGLVVYAVTMTFFATDWMVALDQKFYSTIYPMLEAGGELAGAFAAGVLGLYLLAPDSLRAETADKVRLSEDLANLLFGFVLLWVYLAFMQWLIVWSGDLPEEIGWYLTRSSGPWPFVLWAIILLHGVVPTAGFLSRRLKRSPRGLALLALSVLAGHLLDVVWRIQPAFPTGVLSLVITIAAFVALGGLWLAVVREVMTRHRLRQGLRRA